MRFPGQAIIIATTVAIVGFATGVANPSPAPATQRDVPVAAPSKDSHPSKEAQFEIVSDSGAPQQHPKPIDLANAPRLEISPPTWDFGEVWYGAPLETVLTVKNAGNGILELQRPRTSCGCTGSLMGATALRPGETTTLSLHYDSTEGPIRVYQTVELISNDPVNPVFEVPVRGKVNPVLTFEPAQTRSISFGQVDGTAASSKELIIKNAYANAAGGRKIRLALAEHADLPHYAIKLRVLVPGMEYKLVVSTVPPLPPGLLEGRVVLETDLDLVRSFAIGLSAYVRPLVQISPNVLYVAQESTDPSIKRLTLISASDLDLKLKRIECNSEQVTWTVVEQPGRSGAAYRHTALDIAVPPGREIPPQGFELRIITNLDDPAYRELKVPIQSAPKRHAAALAERH